MSENNMNKRTPFNYRTIKFKRPGVYLPDVDYLGKIKKLLSYTDEDNIKRFEFTLKVLDENNEASKFTKYFLFDTDPESILSKFLYSMDAIGDDGIILDDMLINSFVVVKFRRSKLGNLYIATMYPWVDDEEDQEANEYDVPKDNNDDQYEEASDEADSDEESLDEEDLDEGDLDEEDSDDEELVDED